MLDEGRKRLHEGGGEGGRTVKNTLKGVGTEKKENKQRFQKWGKKKGGRNPLTNYATFEQTS